MRNQVMLWAEQTAEFAAFTFSVIAGFYQMQNAKTALGAN